MKRSLNVNYNDIKITFNLNQILLNALQNFCDNFTFHPKPIVVDNKIRKELENYINFYEEK
jgi:hypothetical protein